MRHITFTIVALTMVAGCLSTPVAANCDGCLGPRHITRLPLIRTTINTVAEMDAIVRYLEHVYTDGDVLNDWLTHVRPDIRDALQALGQSIEGARQGRFTFTVTFEGELHDQAEFLRGWTWARREGYSAYQSMWIGMGEVLDNHLEEDVMDSVWLVIEEQCVN